MDLDHRPHFRTAHHSNTTTNELFICFTSRLSSSSSMKLTKSILSPGRASREAAGAAPISLSSSLSRRLRSNGSLKGGASPFLATTTTTGGRKRGGGFENPEPSSPKVTCIGQVRVKTKKKVNQNRSPSKRRSGEMSFRKTEQQLTSEDNNNGGDKDKDKMSSHQGVQIRYSNAGGSHYHHHQLQQQQPAQECLRHRNQRWVHLPISICEALREFSCLFPCKSSCFSKDKDENRQNGSNENGCGAVCARWLVSVNDGEGGKRREIELVVGGGDDEEEEEMAAAERVSVRRSSRRHVFEDIEVKDDRIEIKGQNSEGEEEKARVSICIPPKNALLLMRCRSDPMRMASLANRFSWDAQGVCKNDTENLEVEKNEVCVEQGEEVRGCEGKDEVLKQEFAVLVENNEECEEISDEADQENLELMEVGEFEQVEENKVEDLLVISSDEMVEQEIVKIEDKLVEKDEEEVEVESNMSSFEALLDQETEEHYEDSPIIQDEEVKDSSPETVESNETPPVLEEDVMEKENDETAEELDTITEKDSTFPNNDEEENRVIAAQIEPDPETTHQEDDGQGKEEENSGVENPENQLFLTSNINEEPKNEKESPILPDCLLLMMCEPKLSMEVSKETWVCTTDFVRWVPAPAKAGKASGGVQEPVKRRISTDSKPNKPPPARNNNAHHQQQPRSSCSLPAATTATTMATVLEQKLVNAVGYEPFVLTRCKSEPMKTAATKLMPESCFWKSAVGKMEPHRRAALGVGAAGVGF